MPAESDMHAVLWQIVSLLSTISSALNCDAWALHWLVKGCDSKTMLVASESEAYSHLAASPTKQGVAKCFKTGMHCFHNLDPQADSGVGAASVNTLDIPILVCGNVCAVAHLEGKRASDGSVLVNFLPADAHSLSLCAAYIADVIEVVGSSVSTTDCIVDGVSSATDRNNPGKLVAQAAPPPPPRASVSSCQSWRRRHVSLTEKWIYGARQGLSDPRRRTDEVAKRNATMPAHS